MNRHSKFGILFVLGIFFLSIITFMFRYTDGKSYSNNEKQVNIVLNNLVGMNIEEVDKKHFLVFKDLKIKINKKEKDNYEKGKEYLIITIKKHHIILDADKYYYVH